MMEYHDTIKNVTVTYADAGFTDPIWNEKLKRYNFQDFGACLNRAVGPTFAAAGVSASYTAKAGELPAAGSVNTPQLILITPTKASTTAHKNRFTGEARVTTGPSSNPTKLAFDVFVVDNSLKKKVWGGEFYLVVGGLLYGTFSDSLATSFLTDIIKKLRDDGLIAA